MWVLGLGLRGELAMVVVIEQGDEVIGVDHPHVNPTDRLSLES